MKRLSRQRRICLGFAAVAPVVASICPAASAGGNWDGDQASGVRTWGNFVNWDFDSFPGPAEPIVFGTSGAGTVDMGFAVHSHPSMTFSDWVTYNLFQGTFSMAASGGGVISVGASVSSTNGSDYLQNPSGIGGAPTFLDMGGAGGGPAGGA